VFELRLPLAEVMEILGLADHTRRRVVRGRHTIVPTTMEINEPVNDKRVVLGKLPVVVGSVINQLVNHMAGVLGRIILNLVLDFETNQLANHIWVVLGIWNQPQTVRLSMVMNPLADQPLVVLKTIRLVPGMVRVVTVVVLALAIWTNEVATLECIFPAVLEPMW